MDILPAWLIEELKKMKEEEHQKTERRLYIDIPSTIEREEPKEEEESAYLYLF